MQRHGIDASATEDASDATEEILKNLDGGISPGGACPSGSPAVSSESGVLVRPPLRHLQYMHMDVTRLPRSHGLLPWQLSDESVVPATHAIGPFGGV